MNVLCMGVAFYIQTTKCTKCRANAISITIVQSLQHSCMVDSCCFHFISKESKLWETE